MLDAMRRRGASLLLICCVSCVPALVQSSALPTGPALQPSFATVQISATRDPAQGTEIGVAEAHGYLGVASLDALIAEFRSRVASMGGDYGRIDSVATKGEMRLETVSYECGGFETTTETTTVMQLNPDGSMTPSTDTATVNHYVSKTCTEDRWVEVFTLTVLGRAFRTAGEMR